MEIQNQPNIPELGPHKSWLSRHMVLGFVFLGLVLGAAVLGVYSMKYGGKQGSLPQNTNNIPQGPTDNTCLEGTVDCNDTINTKIEKPIIYTNSQFGFSLTLTDAWKGYKVYSSMGSQGVGHPDYLQFSMPTTDETKCVQSVTDQACGYSQIFEITIFDKSIWDQMTPDQKKFGQLLGENSSSVYIYDIRPGALPADLIEINFEIPKVISTFKITVSPFSAINTFTKCADAGYPIMESFPEQCRTPDGVTFTKQYQACVQVITPAKNPKTGEVRDFPTPCDVPAGWEKVSNSSQ